MFYLSLASIYQISMKKKISTCPGLNLVQYLVQFILAVKLSALTNPYVDLQLIIDRHQDVSQTLKASFSQSEEAFLRVIQQCKICIGGS